MRGPRCYSRRRLIQVRGLSKRYGSLTAVDGVSFSIAAGEAFGLLGPNGAGKSTIIHMLGGLIEASSGEIQIDGSSDPTKPSVRAQLGISPQGLAIYDDLTGEENLSTFGSLYGLSGSRLKERIHWALEFAGLSDRRKDRVHAYSGGMKRRLNLACAVIHDPRVLICDEPTVGVDPQSRNHIFDSIEALRKQGTTLLYTTHYMEEASRLCDRVAIMDHGKILAVDTVDKLIAAHGGKSVVHAELNQAPKPGTSLPGTLEGTAFKMDTDRPFEVVAELGRSQLDIRSLNVVRPDLERVFLKLTGRRLRDE